MLPRWDSWTNQVSRILNVASSFLIWSITHNRMLNRRSFKNTDIVLSVKFFIMSRHLAALRRTDLKYLYLMLHSEPKSFNSLPSHTQRLSRLSIPYLYPHVQIYDQEAGSQLGFKICWRNRCVYGVSSRLLKLMPSRAFFTGERNDPSKVLEDIISKNPNLFRGSSGLEDYGDCSLVEDSVNTFFDNAKLVTEGLQALAVIHPAIGGMPKSINWNCQELT